MKRVFYFLLFCCITVLSSCSGYQLINSEVYNNANLAAYRTYRIVQLSEGKLPDLMTKVDYSNISNAIRNEMQLRGYRESPQSDLLINIGLTIEKKIETEPAVPPGGFFPYNGFAPYYIYPRYAYMSSYYSNAKIITGIYKEGVLSMDFVNIDKKMVLYSSSVSTILDNGKAELRNVSAIDQAVKVLFSRFPVKPLATSGN